MKHLIIIITLLVTSQTTFSQYYLGLTEKEARSLIRKNEDKPINLDRVILKDDEACLTWYIKSVHTSKSLYFDLTGKSYMLCLTPDNSEMVNTIIKLYNDNYVKVADDEWNYYASSGIVVRVKVQYVATTGKYAIFFSERED